MTKENRPKYVATVVEGLTQSERCQYFIGSTQRFLFGNGKAAVVVFANPPCSGVNVYMNKISSSNLSASPVSIDIYTRAKVGGHLKRSFDIVPGDLNCIEAKPKTQLLYGSGASILEGKRIYVETITPFDTLRGLPSGSIILPPGTHRAYLFQTIYSQELTTVSMGFNWWEERC